MSFRRWCCFGTVFSLILFGIVAAIPGVAEAAVITNPAGPLTSVNIGTTLSCQVNVLGDTSPEWYAHFANCGTFLSLGGVTYKPADVRGVNGTAFTPVSQTPVTGSGTAADPFQVVTTVQAGSSATLTQTDRYVSGTDFYTTDLAVTNIGPGPLSGTVWSAGDCYAAQINEYGIVNGTSPSCTTTQSVNSRANTLIPRTSGNSYEVNYWDTIWSRITTRTALSNACIGCNAATDNGIAVSWPLNLSSGQSQAFSWATSFGVLGGSPLAVSATPHAATSPAGTANGYRVQVANPSAGSQTVSSVSVTLPPGFSYQAGSTTGVTTSDPAISGQVLTWTGPFSLSGGAITTVDFGVTVSGTPGTFTIDAAAASAQAVIPAGSTAPVTVTALADLSLVKTASVPDASPGDTFSYALAVHNAGPSGVPSATVTDALPAGLSFVSGAGCTASGQTVTCDTGAIAAGGDASLTVTVAVSPGAALGVVTNNAVVTSGVPDPDNLNNAASEAVLIRHAVDLTITKTASPPTVTAGSDVTFTITAGNAGTGTATALLVDSLPAGLSAVSFTGAGCVLGTLRCTMPVPAGGTQTVTMVAQASDTLASGTVLTNTVNVNAPDNTTPTGVSATASVTVDTAAHLVLAKTLLDGLQAGRTGTYQVTVQNQGPSYATGVTVTDTLPAGVTVNPAGSSPGCSGTATVTCPAGSIGVGQSAELTIAVNVPAATPAGTSLANTASAAADQPNPVPADAAGSVTGTVTRLADLVLSKVGTPDPVVAGGTITYTLPVTDNGPSDAGGVTVTDTMPAGVTATAATVTTGTGTCTLGATVTCSLGTVTAGLATVITITGAVAPSASGILTNTAAVTSADPVLNPATTTAAGHNNVIATTGLSASNVSNSDPVAAGAPLDYTLSAVNKGPSNATHVAFSDPLPTGYTATSATASNGAACTLGGGVLTCPDLGTLGVNGSVTVTLHGTVDAARPAGTLTSTLTVTDAEGGSVPAQDASKVFTDTGITVTKTSPLTTVNAGGTATWTVSVHNAGPSDAVNVPVTEVPGPSVTIAALSPGSGTCDTATLACTIAAIPANGTVDIQVTGTVDADTPPGTVTNCASYKSPAGPAGDSTGCSDLAVTQLAALTLANASQPVTTAAGTRVIYQLTAGNAGPSTATGTVVTDTLPTGMTFDAAGSSSGCTAAGQVVTCPAGTLSPTATANVLVVATADPAVNGTVTNVAVATAVQAPAQASASADTVIKSLADLLITKTAAPVFAGQDLTWSITVGSIGPSTATGVVIDSTIPAGLGFVSATASSGTCAFQPATGLVTCHPGPIAKGDVVTVALVTHVPASLVPPGKPFVIVTDPATVSYAGDFRPDNNVATAATAVLPLATMHVTATVSPAPVVAGTLATVNVTVTNAGPSTATGVSIAKKLLPGVVFVAHGSDPRCTALNTASTQVKCTAATLNPGASTTFPVVVKVAPTLGSGSVLTSDLQATAGQSNPAAVAATRVSARVIRRVDLVVTKTASGKTAAAGSPFSFTVRVVNQGPSAASNVVVSDQALSSLAGRLRPGDGIAVTCTRGGASFRCTVPELLPGASVAFTVDVTTRPGTANGTLTCDTARVTAREPGTRPADNHATACATITSQLLPPLFVPVTG